MSKALKIFSRFLKDEDGAALVEYTVLLGVLLIAVIATIGLVGTWIPNSGLRWIRRCRPDFGLCLLGRDIHRRRRSLSGASARPVAPDRPRHCASGDAAALDLSWWALGDPTQARQ
jgi:pilus assembly protein Flp/PilA